MSDVARLLATIGDYEMQRRQLADTNQRLVELARGLVRGEVNPSDVDAETLAIKPSDESTS